ncbi:MAG: hypothetical protein CVV64_10940 [Candidatus Wallbacteria bacterium HGW-Wallbacteria-1]|jgi:molybdopterin-binding protein|uniref:HTH cro/C1-type domain-containing protein n=1 Tax=Candidatus Wallbacteria bacterium HGW-Wallbacteria-1 TaxID=2013854 RepID=A0A2N1PPH8_9BACT|nr:MAG: hypothetical protein CVV64_10940 [Candidatus Wallbacteria bacterium HGW-Wallbacteria-1]
MKGLPNAGFGPVLRELRKKRGLTLRELAAKVNMDYTRLSKIESGLRPVPDIMLLAGISKALGADLGLLARAAGVEGSIVVQSRDGINLIPGTIISHSDGLALVKVAEGVEILALSSIERGKVNVAVRPETITLSRVRPESSSARNSFEAKVAEVHHREGLSSVILRLGDLEVRAMVTNSALSDLAVTPGMTLTVTFKAAASNVEVL